MNFIECPDLSENRQVEFYASISGKSYHFVVKWNEFCDCAILDIYDSKDNEIKTGNFLTCNSVIKTDKREFPALLFKHKENSTLEPSPETFKDYRIFYEDTSD